MNAPTCFVCGKTAAQIPEYQVQVMAEAEVVDDNGNFVRYDDMEDPNEWVVDNEGTYNPETNRFCCTDCYIHIGCPANDLNDPRGGWKAP